MEKGLTRTQSNEQMLEDFKKVLATIIWNKDSTLNPGDVLKHARKIDPDKVRSELKKKGISISPSEIRNQLFKLGWVKPESETRRKIVWSQEEITLVEELRKVNRSTHQEIADNKELKDLRRKQLGLHPNADVRITRKSISDLLSELGIK